MKKNKTEVGKWYINGDVIPEYAKTTEDIILEELIKAHKQLEEVGKQLEEINKKLNG